MRDELRLLPAVYQSDPWLCALFSCARIVHQGIVDEVIQLRKDMFADTLSERQLIVEEFSCGLDSNAVSNLDTRRALVEARWKSGGKCGIELLQTICDSWKNGQVDVSFVDGTIVLTFCGGAGIPENIDALKSAIETARPAHLPVSYGYVYLMIADVNAMTISQIEQTTMDQFAGGVGYNAQNNTNAIAV